MENSTLIKYPLGWGNSVCVRQALLSTLGDKTIVFGPNELLQFNYTDHTGDPDLVEITRKVVERQVGREYRHLFLVHGATGGVVIGLRAYQQMGKLDCHTRNAPYYVRYPTMIKASGLKHLDETFHISKDESVILLDVPSNPLGLTTEIRDTKGAPILLDGVYFNNIYMTIKTPAPSHDVAVGSYSKLLGINGLRIGWIATNDDLLAVRLADLITSEYCGLSASAAEIAKSILRTLNWDAFEFSARMRLDYNREEWSKLEKFLPGNPVPINGMFHYSTIDQKATELFEKSGIQWTKGSDLGTIDDYGRFNIGQDPALIRSAVKAVLKNDRIKP